MARTNNQNLSCWRLLFFTILVTCGQPALAYDLMQAYRDAVANDAELNSARAGLEAARHRVDQTRALRRPQVGASAGLNRNWQDTNFTPQTSFTSRNYGIDLNWPVFSRENTATIDLSKLQLLVNESQFADAQQDLILRVAQAYFDVLAAIDEVETVQSEKAAIAEQLAAAKRNFEVGTATVTDQQEAQARFDLAVARELASLNDLAVQRSALTLLTSKPVNEVLDLVDGVKLKGPEPLDESAWTQRARDENLGVRQAVLGTEIAKREIKRQRYSRYPTLGVVGNLGRAENPSGSLIGVDTSSASLGLQLAVPLYTGGATSARIREAAANFDKAGADLEIVRRAAEQGARQAYLGLISGLGQVRALEAAEKSSQLALDSNRLGYQVGVRINIDVLNAQQQLFSTQRDLAGARYDVLVNGLRLKATNGTVNENDLRSVAALLTVKRKTPTEPSAVKPTTTRKPARKTRKSRRRK